MNQENSAKASNLEEKFQPPVSPVNLLEQLLFITESFISVSGEFQSERDLDIIKKRFGLNNENVYSLEQIGTYYDISKERVRQIEFKIISKLSELMYGSSKIKEFKPQEISVQEYKQVKDSLFEMGYILTEEDIKKFFQDRYGIRKESKSFFTLSFLMKLLGYCPISSNTNEFRGSIKLAWCLKEKFNRTQIKKTFNHLSICLSKPNEFDLFEIFSLINKDNAKGQQLDKDFIRMLVELCIEIEKLEGREYSYQVKIECLSSVAGRAFRVLQKHGSSLHLSAIAKDINQAGVGLGERNRVTVDNLKNQLIEDRRFKAIGRSGEWILSGWEKVDTRKIYQIMEDSFHESGEPLSSQEVYQYVVAKRPDASFKSISAYLSSKDDIFERVGRNKYALIDWRLKPAISSIRRSSDEASDLICVALKEIFSDKDSISFADLIYLLKERTKLGDTAIRKRIKSSRNFELKQEESSNYYTVYCLNKNFEEIGSNFGSGKELKRDRIQKKIISILQAVPNEPITKGSLYLKVKKEVACVRSTFYRYLSEMSAVRQYKKDGKHYCEYQEQRSSININPALLATCSNVELLNRLERAIKKLNIDEVDLGLFELGRIFENELKDYLVIAKQHSTISAIQVYRKDLEKLVLMIECVVREKVVSKGYYLHILREERNERAHGKIPNLDERKVILNKAHYVAELYIENIIFFNDQKNKILAQVADASTV